MASFLTQCPGCITSFRVTDTQLEAAAGMVRCGACLSVFSAPANRITLRTPVDPSQVPVLSPDTELENALDAAGYAVPSLDMHADDADRDVPLGDLDLDLHASEDEDDEFDEEEDADDDDDFDDDALIDDEDDGFIDNATEVDEAFEYNEEDYEEDADDEQTSRGLVAAPLNLRSRRAAEPADKRKLREYLAALEDEDALEPLDDYDLDALSEPVTISERQTVRRTLRFLGLVLLNLVLIAVLVLQYMNANLDTLSRSQRLAPLMSRVCQVLECPLPEQSDLGSLSSQDLLVRSHPRYAGALEVSFIFRNDSSDAQPFPALELSFSDAADQVIANRLFQPADYLPPELLQMPAMPGQQTLQITLELADPGSAAVNYTIAFRAP